MTRQKEQEDEEEKKGDRKGERNDSPEIPDKRTTSDSPVVGVKRINLNKNQNKNS